jgi:hypothetical protein
MPFLLSHVVFFPLVINFILTPFVVLIIIAICQGFATTILNENDSHLAAPILPYSWENVKRFSKINSCLAWGWSV